MASDLGRKKIKKIIFDDEDEDGEEEIMDEIVEVVSESQADDLDLDDFDVHTTAANGISLSGSVLDDDEEEDEQEHGGVDMPSSESESEDPYSADSNDDDLGTSNPSRRAAAPSTIVHDEDDSFQAGEEVRICPSHISQFCHQLAKGPKFVFHCCAHALVQRLLTIPILTQPSPLALDNLYVNFYPPSFLKRMPSALHKCFNNPLASCDAAGWRH